MNFKKINKKLKKEYNKPNNFELTFNALLGTTFILVGIYILNLSVNYNYIWNKLSFICISYLILKEGIKCITSFIDNIFPKKEVNK